MSSSITAKSGGAGGLVKSSDSMFWRPTALPLGFLLKKQTSDKHSVEDLSRVTPVGTIPAWW